MILFFYFCCLGRGNYSCFFKDQGYTRSLHTAMHRATEGCSDNPGGSFCPTRQKTAAGERENPCIQQCRVRGG